MTDIYKELAKPFPASAIHWRVGATTKDKTKGIALAYVDARDVMDRLDAVVGPGHWKTEITETPSGRVLCTLSINTEAGFIGKTDGAGSTDVEGDKGGISDAFKRAAVQWGVGRYLYRLPNTWVPIKQAGRSYTLVSPPKLPSWALPEGDTSTPVVDEPEQDSMEDVKRVAAELFPKYEPVLIGDTETDRKRALWEMIVEMLDDVAVKDIPKALEKKFSGA